MDKSYFVRRERKRSLDHVVAVYCILALVTALAALTVLHYGETWGLPLETVGSVGRWFALSGVVNLICAGIWARVFRVRT